MTAIQEEAAAGCASGQRWGRGSGRVVVALPRGVVVVQPGWRWWWQWHCPAFTGPPTTVTTTSFFQVHPHSPKHGACTAVIPGAASSGIAKHVPSPSSSVSSTALIRGDHMHMEHVPTHAGAACCCCWWEEEEGGRGRRGRGEGEGALSSWSSSTPPSWGGQGRRRGSKHEASGTAAYGGIARRRQRDAHFHPATATMLTLLLLRRLSLQPLLLLHLPLHPLILQHLLPHQRLKRRWLLLLLLEVGGGKGVAREACGV